METGGLSEGLNIGFKIGFLLVVIGLITYVNEMMKDTFVEMFNLLDFWDFINMMPAGFRIILGGAIVILVSMSVGYLKDKIGEMVDALFGRERPFSV